LWDHWDIYIYIYIYIYICVHGSCTRRAHKHSIHPLSTHFLAVITAHACPHSLFHVSPSKLACARFRFIDNVGSNWLFRGNEPVINGTFANTQLRASMADVSRAPVVVAAGGGW